MSVADDYQGPRELIQKARAEGKWLHCRYQDLWFSPDDLERENQNGRFRWGPVNWTLQNPQEMIDAAERRAAAAQAEAQRIKARVEAVS